MILIIIMTIIIYLILLAWTWHNLGGVEKTKKVAVILIGTIAMYIITIIVFQISKSGINYPTAEIQNDIKNTLVAIFTGLNGIIVMPQIGKIIDEVNEEKIEKETFKKRIMIILFVFILCIVFESGYMKDTQEGILKIYNSH